MPRKRNGSIFKLKDWANNELNVYLPNRESEALKYIIKRSECEDETLHPYELAHFLWPDKYPNFLIMTSDQNHIFENGVSEAMSVVSNIRSIFRDFIKEESLLGIYDPFPFFIMNDPRSDFRAIALSDGVEVIKCTSVNTKEDCHE